MISGRIVSILVLCSGVAMADDVPPASPPQQPPPPAAATSDPETPPAPPVPPVVVAPTPPPPPTAEPDDSRMGVEVAAVGAVIAVAPSTKVGPGGGAEVQVFNEDKSGRALGADALFTVHTSTIGTVYLTGLGIERRYGHPGGGFYWGFRVSATYLWSGDSSARGIEPGMFIGVRGASTDLATGLMFALGSYHAGSVCSGYCDGAFLGFVLAMRVGFSFAG